MASTDLSTQNLLKGLNLLLTLYPKAKVRMGFSREELHVRGMGDDLVPETKKILEDWDWTLNFYEETYYWEYELKGTIDDVKQHNAILPASYFKEKQDPEAIQKLMNLSAELRNKK